MVRGANCPINLCRQVPTLAMYGTMTPVVSP